ncbi:hypothetical protein Sta7437_4841 (plasmid) [Stanieria cyanosphaera PCC 7437]|uniref:Uncharacterized protein n=1 Tax=Stanieria cyanosphaera (strain ATCC 29371 / PCC 7437) TaxID=111780 RepID=K9Y1R7_STAC7|nr:hypothetical protein [Stanieria cyanosphaera]AFZ38274.1 hypothetical protein Sta7437_4841 [Stanieria cyanosphaera PCC 7437]
MTRHHSYLTSVGWTILYLVYIWWFGTRIIILITGAVIILLFNFDSLKQLVRSYLLKEGNDLLNTRNFQHRFKATKRLLNRSDCQNAIATVLETQELARAIAQLQPASIPELLDTLHDVLNDAEKIAQASQVKRQVNNSQSELTAKQHLDNYQLQLERRHQQLQQIYHQIQLDRL